MTLWCHTNLTTIEINYFFLECVSDIDMSWHNFCCLFIHPFCLLLIYYDRVETD